MDFSDALHNLKQGRIVTRKAWSTESDLIASVEQVPFTYVFFSKEEECFVCKSTSKDETVVMTAPWEITQKDILAEDWELV